MKLSSNLLLTLVLLMARPFWATEVSTMPEPPQPWTSICWTSVCQFITMMPSVLPEPSQVTVRSRIWTGSPVLAELSTYALDARTKLIGPSCFSTVPVVDPPTYVRSPASTMPLVSRQVPMIWITVPGALVSITACILAASPVLSRHVTPYTPGGRPVVACTTMLVLVLLQAASAMHPMAIHGTQQAIHSTRWVFTARASHRCAVMDPRLIRSPAGSVTSVLC